MKSYAPSSEVAYPLEIEPLDKIEFDEEENEEEE